MTISNWDDSLIARGHCRPPSTTNDWNPFHFKTTSNRNRTICTTKDNKQRNWRREQSINSKSICRQIRQDTTKTHRNVRQGEAPMWYDKPNTAKKLRDQIWIYDIKSTSGIPTPLIEQIRSLHRHSREDHGQGKNIQHQTLQLQNSLLSSYRT